MILVRAMQHWCGVFYRGIKRLPSRLQLPSPEFEGDRLEPDTYRIAVYFADQTVNLYQIRQWYGPLRKLDQKHRVLIIARDSDAARLLDAESNLTVGFFPAIGDLEEELKRQLIDVVFYVNQNARNFQMMRYGDPAHVFISHGESDKDYMASNQYKTYDFAFVAGSAAKQRLATRLWGYSVDERVLAIGRPQVDYFKGTPPYPANDGRVTVLYSPTWEGDRPSMRYGSIQSHGVEIAKNILADQHYRLIYRPHPRSGINQAEYREAHERIISMIERANDQNPSAGHYYDREPELTWQLRDPELVICDVSAMLYDRLAVGKPLLVTKPIEPQTRVEEGEYLNAVQLLAADDTTDILSIIQRQMKDESAQRELETWSEFYFGDQRENVTQRFLAATETILKRVRELRDST